MAQLKLRVLNDNEESPRYTYNVIFDIVSYVDLKAVATQLQVQLEEKIYPIKICFSGKTTSIYETFVFYFTRKQAKKLLKNIVPCPKEGMELYFRGTEWEG